MLLSRLLSVTVVACLLLLSGCGAHVYHEVRKDDTLYAISWRYNQQYQNIAKWNELKPPYRIHAGQWLRVAPPALTSSSLRPPPVLNKDVPPLAATKVSPSRQMAPPLKPVLNVVNWQWPVSGKVIKGFQPKSQGKQGIDIAGEAGMTVSAAAAGKVVYSGNGLRGYGNLIIIMHNQKLLSAYAHNRRLLVNEGDQVKAGQAIASMGKTESDRVKLHFEIRVNGKPVNPARYLPKRAS